MIMVKNALSNNADNLWENIINHWTTPCIQCLWPTIYQRIDWQQSIERIELPTAFKSQTIQGAQSVNLLYQFALEEEACLIWIHVATKVEEPHTLARQIFYLSAQLLTQYKQPILPLVIILAADSTLQIEPYVMKVLQETVYQFTFKSVSLTQWLGQEEELLDSSNPFENIIGLYLNTYNAPADSTERYQLKLSLYQTLLRNCENEVDFLSKYHFLDKQLPLTETDQKRYYEEVYQLEREKKMNYLTKNKQFGVEQWIQKGVENAKRDLLKKMIARGTDRSTMKEMLDLNMTDIEFNRLLIFEYSNESPNSVTEDVDNGLQSI